MRWAPSLTAVVTGVLYAMRPSKNCRPPSAAGGKTAGDHANVLMRGRRLHQALSTPLRDVATEYVLFGGDGDLMPARRLGEEVDGHVTKASRLARDGLAPDAIQLAFYQIAYAVFICRCHADLPSDITFRDNLLDICTDRDDHA